MGARHGDGARRHRNRVALARVQRQLGRGRLLPAGDPRQAGSERSGRLRVQKRRQRLPLEAIARHPEQSRSGPIRLLDDSEAVGRDQRVGRQVEEAVESVALHLQGARRPGEFLALDPELLVRDTQLLRALLEVVEDGVGERARVGGQSGLLRVQASQALGQALREQTHLGRVDRLLQHAISKRVLLAQHALERGYRATLYVY